MATNANWRLDPFTNLYNYETITDEIQTVALDDSLGRYGIRLNESPKITAVGTVLTIYENLTGGSQWLEISSSIAPSAGEYRVDRVFDTGFVEFAAGDNGKEMRISYVGKGSVVSLQSIGQLLQQTGSMVNTSALCTSWNTTTTSFSDITNLSVNMTTYGEYVRIYLIGGFVKIQRATEIAWGLLKFQCDGADVYPDSTDGRMDLQSVPSGGGVTNTTLTIPPSAFCSVYLPSAGSHTFTASGSSADGTNISVANVRLVVERLIQYPINFYT